MKLFLLLSSLMLLSSNVFAGQDKGNGGDPYEIWATNFPESQKIHDAIELVESKLTNANLPKEFIDNTIYELNFLERNDRYRYLGNVILMPGADEGYGYKIPGDEGHFLGLGAFTKNEKGAPVYFTERTLKYDADKFAELLLHEVFHHVLSTFLGTDEGFVKQLVKEVWTGEVSALLRNSLEHGYYLPKGEFYKTRWMRAIAIIWTNTIIKFNITDLRYGYHCTGDLEKCLGYLMRGSEDLPENLWEVPVLDFKEISSDRFVKHYLLLGVQSALYRLGYEVQSPFETCIEYTDSFFNKRCKTPTLMKDLILK